MRLRWLSLLLALAPGCSRDNPAFGLDGSGSAGAETGDGATATSGAADTEPSAGSGGSDGGTSTAGDTTTDDATGEPPAVCDKQTECVPAPADGWIGPVVVRSLQAIGPEPCPEERFPDLLQAGHTGPLGISPPTCCSCTTGEFSCDQPFAAVYSDAKCEMEIDSPIDEKDCVSWGGFGVYFSAFSTAEFDEACIALDPVIPAPVAGGPVAVCSQGADAPSCDDGVCLPPGAGSNDNGRCIAKEGDTTCPVDWPNPTKVRVVNDTRTCDGPCTCGDASAEPYCVGYLDIFSDSECLDQVEAFPEGECVFDLPAGEPRYASVSSAGFAANCDAAEVGFSGEVTEPVAYTVCCKPLED